MKGITVNFCCICGANIISRDLSDFWKYSCFSSVVYTDWVPVISQTNFFKKGVSLLEKKGFLISIDHEDLIFIRPNGIQLIHFNEFVVCLNHRKHQKEFSTFDGQ